MVTRAQTRKRRREPDTDAPAQPDGAQPAEPAPLGPQAPTEARAKDPGIVPSLGPIVKVRADAADRLWKELVLALESGIYSEVAWSLNTLQVLIFTDKDRWRRSLPSLGRLPGLVAALSALIEAGRVGRGSALQHDALSASLPRAASPHAPGNEPRSAASQPELENQRDPTSAENPREPDAAPPPMEARSTLAAAAPVLGSKAAGEERLSRDLLGGPGAEDGRTSWWDDAGLLALGRSRSRERLECAVAASSVLRNVSFFPDHARALAGEHELVLCLADVMADWRSEDSELVTSAVETVHNISAHLRLSAFCDLEDGHTQHLPPPPKVSPQQFPEQPLHSVDSPACCRVGAVLGGLQEMLWHPAKAWHCAAAESLGRMIAGAGAGRGGNMAFLLPFSASCQLFERLSSMLVDNDMEVRASAVFALQSFVDTSVGARARIAEAPKLIPRVIAALSSFPNAHIEAARRAAAVLGSLAADPKGHEALRLHEEKLVEVACCEKCKVPDTLGQVLLALRSAPQRTKTAVLDGEGNIWATTREI